MLCTSPSEAATSAWEISSVIAYLFILVGVGVFTYRKQNTAEDFIIGDRSMSFWLTALAAHASDMSSWIFLAYPAAIYMQGLSAAWIAIGLVVFMALNWLLIAPKIRVATEMYGSLTFSSFFESRLADTSGRVRVLTSIMAIIFYTVYISAGLTGLGFLMKSLFGMVYWQGIIAGILIVIPYVFLGGYSTLAYIDLFQGTFLMMVIIFVPLWILPKVGGFPAIDAASLVKGVAGGLIPVLSPKSIFIAIMTLCSWGLGYFGQPHIVTKFMGIRCVKEVKKSMFVGMSWMVLSLTAATLVGLVSIAYFGPICSPLSNSEHNFVELVRKFFPPAIVGFILCAVIAATINAMSSQVLVLTSSLTEDLYKRVFNKNASNKQLLIVSRLGVLFAAVFAFIIAFPGSHSIFSIVNYAWSGLGASFGPLLLTCLYSKTVNKHGAWAGIVLGATTSSLWTVLQGWVIDYQKGKLDETSSIYTLISEFPPVITEFVSEIPALVAGFIISYVGIIAVSYFSQGKEKALRAD